VVEKGIVPLATAAPHLPRSMIQLIAGGPGMLADARAAMDSVQALPFSAVRLLAPIPQPPEFLGVGLNYRDHVIEAGLTMPTEPTVFNKQTSCITGPADDVILPAASDKMDYEGELGIVVGNAGRNLTQATAAAAIYGYVIVNDLSARDWQFRSPTVTLGKSFDTHGPIGPWIVTADEVPDVRHLTLRTTVNGIIRQRGQLADMIFDCPSIVAYLSQVMTLRPGTIVTTGTPAGVGHCRQPPAYLRVGDLVTVEITKLGALRNRVVAERQERHA
jgi:2-keto-4-pentenoate hydratase/2-oxohepta-3-ene-1,7-dioic acid hydratase in catechol pathway